MASIHSCSWSCNVIYNKTTVVDDTTTKRYHISHRVHLILNSVDFTDYLKYNYVLFSLSVVSACYCAYIHIYHGQLLVHCIMPCCTCSLLVHHICTRLERINDDDDIQSPVKEACADFNSAQ